MRRVILAFLRHYAPAEGPAAAAAATATASGEEAPPPQPPPQPQPQQQQSRPKQPQQHQPTCQVVVLGAGYDTTWLQLCREHDAAAAGLAQARPADSSSPPPTPPPPWAGGFGGGGGGTSCPADPGAGGGVRPGRDVADVRARVRWVEVDFPDVVAGKARVLLSGPHQQHHHQRQQPGAGGGLFSERAPPAAAAAAAAAPSPAAAAAEQARALVRAQLLLDGCDPPPSHMPPEILGRAYASVGADLRFPEAQLGPALVRAGAATAAAHPAAAAAATAGGGGGGQGAAAAAVSLSLPTLFVAECVLAYLEPAEARGLLEYIGRCSAAGAGPTETAGGGGAEAEAAAAAAGGAAAGGGGNGSGGVPAAVLAYDVVSPDDPFGRQMQANLAARGCPMRGVRAAPDPPAQAERLRAALAGGGTGGGGERAAQAAPCCSPSSAPAAAAGGGALVRADAMCMSEVWSRTLAVDLEAAAGSGGGGGAGAAAAAAGAAASPPQSPFPPLRQGAAAGLGGGGERRRIERLEPLDELEEWELFGRHYCVALGVREPLESRPPGGTPADEEREGGAAPGGLWGALRRALRPPLAVTAPSSAAGR